LSISSWANDESDEIVVGMFAIRNKITTERFLSNKICRGLGGREGGRERNEIKMERGRVPERVDSVSSFVQ
jgi:hypothetical protein